MANRSYFAYLKGDNSGIPSKIPRQTKWNQKERVLFLLK